MTKSAKRKKTYFFEFILCLLALFTQKTAAEIWLSAPFIKQGDVLFIGGHFTENGHEQDCLIDFLDKKYHLQSNPNGMPIAMLPTTPNTPIGKALLQIHCPQDDFHHSQEIEVQDGHFHLQSIQLTPGKSSLKASKHEQEAVNTAINTFSPLPLWSDQPWLKPSQARLSTLYGVRRKYNGVLAKNYFHKGLDFAAATGEPVMAPANGRIVLIGLAKNDFFVHGNCIFIDHGQGLISAYLHLSRIDVQLGQMIARGQTIGAVGDTGIATGPHLHFGLYLHGENINPLPWLMPREQFMPNALLSK